MNCPPPPPVFGSYGELLENLNRMHAKKYNFAIRSYLFLCLTIDLEPSIVFSIAGVSWIKGFCPNSNLNSYEPSTASLQMYISPFQFWRAIDPFATFQKNVPLIPQTMLFKTKSSKWDKKKLNRNWVLEAQWYCPTVNLVFPSKASIRGSIMLPPSSSINCILVKSLDLNLIIQLKSNSHFIHTNILRHSLYSNP